VKTIWKYALPVSSVVTLEMPRHAKVLTVQMQDGGACLWAEVDPEAPKLPRKFFVAGTGHDLPDVRYAYVGTFQPMGGLVFHVFEYLGEYV
jgi:hypothetical protein